MRLNRREFLASTGGLAASLAVNASPAVSFLKSSDGPGAFDFIFFTDTHIEPELSAGRGCEMCFKKIAGIQSDFAIMGGDHVFDALAVENTRAKLVFDLYRQTEQLVEKKLYNAIGNHDVFGISASSKVSQSDPAYGKRMYEEYFGNKTYYSFDHKGYHFFVLDSIQPTPDRMWGARVDDPQLDWLADDLKHVKQGVPIIGITHVPLVTAFPNYTAAFRPNQKYNTLTVANSPQVLELLENCNVLAVLQGHTHINEIVTYKNVQFITSGAVCGNWWRGLRMGTPEGFTVVSLNDGKISTRYETYGFTAIAGPEK